MSFSGTVKDELSRIIPKTAHCREAELSAIIGFLGEIGFGPSGRMMLMIRSDNRNVIQAAAALTVRITGERPEASVTSGRERKGMSYLLAVTDSRNAERILKAAGYLNDRGILRELSVPPKQAVTEKDCCVKAYVRGALLAAGSVSDPAKSYHLEFVCESSERADEIIKLLARFGIQSRSVVRKQSHVVYIKESEGIADTLNLTGAHKALLELENIRVLRGISGKINRSVNCETANLNKTVAAAVAVTKSIEKIRDTIGLKDLPPALREMAEVRLENPDLPLKDLGQLLDPPVGKSGVNHRLRKLKQIAENL